MKSILFVCLGNICRSPLAEGIAKNYISKNNLNIQVESSGTGDWHVGEYPCKNSIKVAALHDIDISSKKSRQVTKNDFNNFDKIIGLDDSNIQNLLKLGCPKNKLFKLGSYGYNNQDVEDPYFYDGFEGFEKVYEMIEICVKNLLDSKVNS
jgi:protein-tyrosine phosphatase